MTRRQGDIAKLRFSVSLFLSFFFLIACLLVASCGKKGDPTLKSYEKNRLAFVSKTPGRTQLINFFAVGEGRFIVDLPGYGYAKVPPEIRARWEGVLSAYLQTREALAGLVLIMDARHPLTPLDEKLLDWFAPTGKPVHMLLTKSEKLSRQQATATLNRVKLHLAQHFSHCTVQLFSSLKKIGVEEAEAVIDGWLRDN